MDEVKHNLNIKLKLINNNKTMDMVQRISEFSKLRQMRTGHFTASDIEAIQDDGYFDTYGKPSVSTRSYVEHRFTCISV